MKTILTSLSQFKAVGEVRFMDDREHFGVLGLIGGFHCKVNGIVDRG